MRACVRVSVYFYVFLLHVCTLVRSSGYRKGTCTHIGGCSGGGYGSPEGGTRVLSACAAESSPLGCSSSINLYSSYYYITPYIPTSIYIPTRCSLHTWGWMGGVAPVMLLSLLQICCLLWSCCLLRFRLECALSLGVQYSSCGSLHTHGKSEIDSTSPQESHMTLMRWLWIITVAAATAIQLLILTLCLVGRA